MKYVGYLKQAFLSLKCTKILFHLLHIVMYVILDHVSNTLAISSTALQTISLTKALG